ncbi:hypothetical protein HQ535_06680, partial [bacterium]|nr:hypothetical protein [bacterium]
MRRPTRLLAAAAVVFGVALPLVGVLGSVRTSGNVIVTATDVVREDLYSFGGRTIIEGRVEGDVFLVSGELIVTGEVTGDITGLVSGPARITGTVGGSVRLAAIRMDLDGVIGDDVA